ncbi:hypothetical protein AAGS40_29655 (plasmid) [Paraburkholderia sp. PREW-6R]|uniref:hypothetical protein n=1 Tax=Paraburkholderia sp. PREW-6R TaxID=3141544 RepID=UPI0031F4D630
MLATSSDYLLRGSLQGLVLESALASAGMLVARSVDSSSLEMVVALLGAVLCGMLILLWRPLFDLTVWKSRRSPFVLDEDVRATIGGRLIGLVLGLGFGITVAAWFR